MEIEEAKQSDPAKVSPGRLGDRWRVAEGQTLKLCPHPHPPDALGLLILNPVP